MVSCGSNKLTLSGTGRLTGVVSFSPRGNNGMLFPELATCTEEINSYKHSHFIFWLIMYMNHITAVRIIFFLKTKHKIHFNIQQILYQFLINTVIIDCLQCHKFIIFHFHTYQLLYGVQHSLILTFTVFIDLSSMSYFPNFNLNCNYWLVLYSPILIFTVIFTRYYMSCILQFFICNIIKI